MCTLQYIIILCMYVMYMQKAIKESLGNRFKEFRRPPKPRVKHSSPSISYKQKSPSLNVDLVMNLPAVPVGEDEAAFKQHNKRLIAESKRNNPSMMVVNECMKNSFEMRRRDLLSELYDINSVFEKYPFLRKPEQVHYMYVHTYQYKFM